MSSELKPCPFCGGTPRVVTENVEPQGDSWYGTKHETFVLCDCGCCLFDEEFHEGFYEQKAVMYNGEVLSGEDLTTEQVAIKAWNTRHTEKGD